MVLIVFATTGCKEKTPPDITVLGFYTPYQAYMEKLNGKVEAVTETNYWAVPEGETFVKGAKMTSKELDSIQYTGDFTARFDEAGDLVSCTYLDENSKVLSKWEIVKENDVMVKAQYTLNDTIRRYDKLKCNPEGEIMGGEVFNAVADTLVQSITGEKSVKGDTVKYQYFNFKGEARNKVLYIYGSSGQLLGFQSYDKDGNYMGGDEVTYDDKGELAGIKFFDKDKNITAENTFTNQYDTKGNPTSTICKDSNGFTVICVRVYTYFK